MANQTNIQPAELTPNWAYRGKSFTNLLHMGHCAPTVMQTLLDLSSIKGEWLVRLSAGMPGGIGNTGFECGALTSPLVMMGLRDGLRRLDGDLPVIFDRGHAHVRQFLACHKTLNCKQIRGNDRFPAHCIPPVVRSPEIYWHILDGDHGEAIPQEERAAYARLYAHLASHEFHCAQAVLLHLGYTPAEDPELFDAVSAFIGGTLFLGKTCSAFTAGVMAAGLKIGEIENSIPRVVRLLAIMTANGNAFDDSLNKFNHSMNQGYRLSKWFVKEFGSTQCQSITGCQFCDPAGVDSYIDNAHLAHCRLIAENVAEKVQLMLEADRRRRERII